jgi:hypothetical protein
LIRHTGKKLEAFLVLGLKSGIRLKKRI